MIKVITSKYNLKDFDDYKSKMPMSAILTFAKFGFHSYQILEQENLLHLIIGDDKNEIPID